MKPPEILMSDRPGPISAVFGGDTETYIIFLYDKAKTVTDEYAITTRRSDCIVQKIELLREDQ